MTHPAAAKSTWDNMPESDGNASSLSKNQILKDLEISRTEIRNGAYKDLEEAIDEIEEKYNLQNSHH